MSNPDNLKQAHAAHEVDYRETMDVTHVHAAAQREKKEPLSGSVPIPLWLISIFAIILCGGSFYYGQYSGGFNDSVYDENAGQGSSPKKAAASTGAAGGAELSMADQGKKLFLANCATCHQPTGLGVPGQYPPLAKSEYVNGTPKRLSMILLKGLQGPIKVEGAAFNGAMPAWEKVLNDKKIAAILTYIRQEWGNTGGEVTADQIAHARAEFKERSESWSEADLLAVPADAVLEGAAAKPANAPEVKK